MRDILLDKQPHDYDLTVSCDPHRTTDILASVGCRTIPTGIAHGTVTALCGTNPIEITSFRVDGVYSDSRHPESVCFTRRISDDLARRDFTVNAMAYNLRVGLVDLYGGISDLSAKLIRAVGDAPTRFREDALRIMRAFRFSAQLGFEIEHETLSAASLCRDGLLSISRERICAELLRLLICDTPHPALSAMHRSGVLSVISGNAFPFDCESVFAAMSACPSSQSARLGLLLTLCNEENAKRFAVSLKCSNKLRNDALAVRDGAFCKISTRADASHLIARLGRQNAADAAAVSVLIGTNSAESASLVASTNTPAHIGELNIRGNDLLPLGLSGVALGAVLSHLFEAVLSHQVENEHDALLALARKIKATFD